MSKRRNREAVYFWSVLFLANGVFLSLIFVETGGGSRGKIQICCLLYALVMALMVFWGYGMHRRMYVELADSICRSIDDLIAGKQAEINKDEEKLTSKIAAKLEALAEITRHTVEESREKKAEVQQMVSDISHQLKTPIANILMYSDTIRECELPREEEARFLEVLHQQVKKMEFLVQALIKMSRLESSLIVPKRSEGNLNQTIVNALAAVAPEAEKKGIHIQADCREMIRLYYDPKWTEEAIFNVLENGVKYTPRGGTITLAVQQWQIYTRITVRDTGIGIDPEHRNDIFKRFYRENKVHEIKGLGIGLYLTRKIFTLQGGYVTVNSKPGEGAEFSLFLPNDKN